MLEAIDAIGSVPTCRVCGSERVVKSAWACWNPEFGLWELEAVFDQEHCHQCEKDTELIWSPAERPPNKRIRDLNDQFRMRGIGNGTMFVTSGIQAEGSAFVVSAVNAVRTFAGFDDDNDPWGEHDFGAVEVDAQKVFFKIDYYASESLDAGSENPANEGVTYRVLTIMLASEY